MDKPSLFISYARADDEPFVKRLHEALTKAGHKVWWDRESMESRGKTFLQEIRDAITDVDRVILVVGPKIHESDYVKAEWEYALEICKVINPILRLGEYALVPDALKNVHAVDCRETRTFETAFDEIKRVIDVPSGELGTLHAVPLLPQWYIRREEDLRDVIKLVCADTTGPVVVTSKKQTVTLQGTGGIGKTTLASAIAQDCDVRRVFPDGVFWLEMGKQPTITLRQGDIGVAFKDTRDEYPDVARGKSRLSEILADKRALLILDDVWQREHAEAFRMNTPRCRLLITTRQQGLTTQLGAATHGLDVLTDDEGVTLIEMRLEIVGQENPHQEIHRQIVHLLGGHTLAVSIAAAQLAERSVDFASSLLERLQKRQGGDNPFKDLTMEESDRQYNLEATLSLSYDALSDDYKRRFRALGVFATEGNFDLAAVAAVWGDESKDIDEAEDALHALWRVSLITREQNERYSQHSLLRTYALALLQRANEVDEYQARHFTHYEMLHGDGNVNNDEDRHPLIRRDLENILLAFEWGLSNEPRRMVDMVWANAYFFDKQDLISLRREWLAKSLEVASQIGYERSQANILVEMGALFVRLGEYEEAYRCYERALPIYEHINDRLGQANTVQVLGDLFVHFDELEEANRCYNHALLVYKQINDKLGQANTLQALGSVLVRLGEFEETHQNYKLALPIFEQIEARLGQANTLWSLGNLLVRLDELEEAHQNYEHALPIFEKIDDKLGQANTLQALGNVLARLGEFEEAHQNYERALSIFEQIQSRLGQASTLLALGDLLVRLDKLEQAKEYYTRALQLYEQIGSRLGQANTLKSLGALLARLHGFDQARRNYVRALIIYEEIDNKLGQANTLRALGDLFTQIDEYKQAHQRYGYALDIYEEIGNRLGQANTLRALGDLFIQIDEYKQARQVYVQALQLYVVIQEVSGHLNILIALANLEEATGNVAKACDYCSQYLSIADTLIHFASHPTTQQVRQLYEELCGN